MLKQTAKFTAAVATIALVAALAACDLFGAKTEEPEAQAITVGALANGTATADKATAFEGETVTLTVTPAAGYVIASVAASGATLVPAAANVDFKASTYSFLMPATAVAVSAAFAAVDKAGWAIAPGDGNGASPSNLYVGRTTAAAEVDSVTGSAGALKVVFESDTAWKMCEIYAALPVADYGQYDGFRFDVKMPYSNNFLLLLRNPNGGTTWKVSEDYVYDGTDADGMVWVTVQRPFSAGVDTGWGPAAAQATLKAWLTADAAVAKQVNINPVLNVGVPGVAVDTPITMFIDNVGFYGAGVADRIVYDFE
jgi:hypothetical protein